MYVHIGEQRTDRACLEKDYTERLIREHAYAHMFASVNTNRGKHHIIMHIAFWLSDRIENAFPD